MSLRTVPSVPYNGLSSTFLSGGGSFAIPSGSGGAMTLTGWSGLTAGQILYPLDATTLTSSPSFLWGADITAGKGLFLAAGTATTDVNALSVTHTFNNAAVAFTTVKVVITDTASAAGALAMQILGGAAGTTNLFSVDKLSKIRGSSDTDMFSGETVWLAGYLRVAGGVLGLGNTGTSAMIFEFASQNKVVMLSTGLFGWSNTGATTPTLLRAGLDTAFSRLAAGSVALGTGAAGSFAGSLKWRNSTMQESSGDAVGVVVNAQKSRGTQGSPTVITTGDDLLTIDAFGYVGATNTFQSAARLIADATGTISDSPTGIGGIWRFLAAKVGAEPAEIAQVSGTDQHLLHVGTVPSITAGGGTDPSIAGTDEAFTVTVGSGGLATSVEVTFASAFAVAPRCSANHQGAILILRCVSTTLKVTIDAATPFTALGKIDVISRSGTT